MTAYLSRYFSVPLKLGLTCSLIALLKELQNFYGLLEPFFVILLSGRANFLTYLHAHDQLFDQFSNMYFPYLKV